MDDQDDVQRLEDVRRLVGQDLHAPGVGGDAGQLALGDPRRGVEGEPGRGTAGVGAPAAGVTALRDLAGADEDDVAAADVHALRVRRRPRGRPAWIRSPGLEPGHATVRAGRRAGRRGRRSRSLALGDVVAHRALAAHLRRVVAVVDLAVEDDVAEGVPLRARLQGQDEQVVGAPDVPVAAAVEVAHGRAGQGGVPVADHQVDRVEPTEAAGLRARCRRPGWPARRRVPIADKRGRGGDVGGLDVVERARAGRRGPSVPSSNSARRGAAPSRCRAGQRWQL